MNMQCMVIAVLACAAGCVGDGKDAAVAFSWGGPVGGPSANGSGEAARAARQIDPCPNWGSIDGPVTSVTAHVVVGDFTTDQLIDCHLGNAAIDVPAGTGTLQLFEELSAEGEQNGDARWIRAFTVDPGDTADVGYIDITEQVDPYGGGYGGGVPDTGGGWTL